ncbi:pur operon repressor [Anaerotalea alkaliphila]|uniref:Pur operon repressor n=1 Tax=Anaerotalea alkaliphila TaxID=2662126 RepID=A0A7X5KM99_9FIRM|nr:pur operon repressor [Anaerotalea alkaliphila]NDL66734.1 pur operon repressor [Anaerotalea alkaliphila]
MEKKRSKAERIAIITKKLVENPSEIHTLQQFSEMFHCAKSTLSEDIDGIGRLFEEEGLGKVVSLPGAAGGIYYSPVLTPSQVQEVQEDICRRLNEYSRVIPGGYVYMNDIFYTPRILQSMARCIVTRFCNEQVDYVVTIETKGVPLAMVIAELLNKPIAVVRKSARLTEGTTMQMNYVTGSNRNIHTMALPIKSIRRGSRVLLVDDFMKAGGTAKGIMDLMKEFDTTVVGVAVVMATREPEKKLINDYYCLVEFQSVDEEKETIQIIPKKM